MKDYLTEIPYISNYYSNLNPVNMVFIAAINNIQPPDIFSPFNYCELGCGCGKSTNVVAGCYPHAHCVGIDINQEHARIAKNESEGLSNIEFFNVSFHDALELNFPKFDFITMHGIWSWVGDDTRSDIIRFIKKFLKTGGLFYISYDSLPGWSQLMPFHKIISMYIKDKNCPITEKAAGALSYLKFLNENRSTFFERSPDAKLFLQTLEQSDIKYVIHELFNKHLRPEYFCDIVEHMGKAGLTFVGNSDRLYNYPMVLTEPFRKLLSTASDRISMESHKSIILNDRFRKDIYCKRKTFPSGPSKTVEYLKPFKFMCTIPVHKINLETNFSNYTLTLNPEPYLKIFEMVYKNPMTLHEINLKMERSANRINETFENISNCLLSGNMSFVLTSSEPRIQQVNPYIKIGSYNWNQIINWDDQYSKLIFLASEMIGESVVISKKNALVLAGICQFGLCKEKVVNYAYDFVEDDIRKGRNIFEYSTGQDAKYLISLDYNSVEKDLVPKLTTLGILSITHESALKVQV
ncbi:MAG: class I SAM-dependent methyltransferase [Holosporaceae bacterium]|jgi:SAM-dependent methyltransferase|nr:class I SAM-dependent methyltransferase [Holosporaceae bacterium]